MLRIAGVVLVALETVMLGNASRFGVPAPLRWRRIRLLGVLLLGLAIVLVVVARIVLAVTA